MNTARKTSTTHKKPLTRNAAVLLLSMSIVQFVFMIFIATPVFAATAPTCGKDIDQFEVSLCPTDEEKKIFPVSTVLEEPLTTPPANQDNNGSTKIVQCYRVTTYARCLDPKSNTAGKNSSLIVRQSYQQPDKEGAPPGDCGTKNEKRGDVMIVKAECDEVTVLMTKAGGVQLMQLYISLVYKWVAGIVGIISVLIMIISGIQIITASGEQEAVTSARKRILQSLAAIVLLFLATIILQVINPTFFENTAYDQTQPTTATQSDAPASAEPATPATDEQPAAPSQENA